MPMGSFALDARITLIRKATSTLDLQYYHIGNDEVGHAILRELYLAAQRGVRVRLLMDDMYTTQLDPLLAALQTAPNVEVRLFNPFTWGRGDQVTRYAEMLLDFSRLNHRMHNKLFIADGAVAIVGGRNLADEYFLRARTANFIDMDFLAMGKLIGELGKLFDEYWNSDETFMVRSVVQARPEVDRLLAAEPEQDATATADVLGQPSLSAVLAGRAKLPQVYVADAFAYADNPSKLRGKRHRHARESVTSRFVQLLASTQQEALIFNPYFIPGSRGMTQIKALRERGVKLSVVTNSMHTSDEPLVNLAYLRYREPMLALGVRLFELSDEGVKRELKLRNAYASSTAQLHAKLGVLDRKSVLAGSVNMDSRSEWTNTEIGILIRSPELAERLLSIWRIDETPSFHEVRRRADGQGLEWVTRNGRDEHIQETDPDGKGNWYQRLLLHVQSLFVAEDLL